MEAGAFVDFSILNSEKSVHNAHLPVLPQIRQNLHELPTAVVVFRVKVEGWQSWKPRCAFLIHTCVPLIKLFKRLQNPNQERMKNNWQLGIGIYLNMYYTSCVVLHCNKS